MSIISREQRDYLRMAALDGGPGPVDATDLLDLLYLADEHDRLAAVLRATGETLTGTAVGGQFVHADETHHNEACDRDCRCLCHDEEPLAAGTYLTIRLDPQHSYVRAGRVTVTFAELSPWPVGGGEHA